MGPLLTGDMLCRDGARVFKGWACKSYIVGSRARPQPFVIQGPLYRHILLCFCLDGSLPIQPPTGSFS